MLDGEDYEISDNEMEQLKADAGKDATSLTPKCYMPIWIPVESPAERIQRAKEQFASVTSKVEMADTSGKDTDSNGKKEGPLNQLLVEETGLTPSMKKLNVGAKTEDGGEAASASPKPKRERKKSKSKSEEKSGDEKEEKKEVVGPKTPTKSTSGESKSPKKKSPEKSSKSPVKAASSDVTSEKKDSV